MPVLGKCKLFESTNKTRREAIDKEREKGKERAATRKKQERYDDVHRWITIPTGLPFMRETSPSAGTANNPISELRLAASDEPLSDYRRSHIDRLRWHGAEWRRRSLEIDHCLLARSSDRRYYRTQCCKGLCIHTWDIFFRRLLLLFEYESLVMEIKNIHDKTVGLI